MVFVGINTTDSLVAQDQFCGWIVRAEIYDDMRLVEVRGQSHVRIRGTLKEMVEEGRER